MPTNKGPPTKQKSGPHTRRFPAGRGCVEVGERRRSKCVGYMSQCLSFFCFRHFGGFLWHVGLFSVEYGVSSMARHVLVAGWFVVSTVRAAYTAQGDTTNFCTTDGTCMVNDNTECFKCVKRTRPRPTCPDRASIDTRVKGSALLRSTFESRLRTAITRQLSPPPEASKVAKTTRPSQRAARGMGTPSPTTPTPAWRRRVIRI